MPSVWIQGRETRQAFRLNWQTSESLGDCRYCLNPISQVDKALTSNGIEAVSGIDWDLRFRVLDAVGLPDGVSRLAMGIERRPRHKPYNLSGEPKGFQDLAQPLTSGKRFYAVIVEFSSIRSVD